MCKRKFLSANACTTISCIQRRTQRICNWSLIASSPIRLSGNSYNGTKPRCKICTWLFLDYNFMHYYAIMLKLSADIQWKKEAKFCMIKWSLVFQYSNIIGVMVSNLDELRDFIISWTSHSIGTECFACCSTTLYSMQIVAHSQAMTQHLEVVPFTHGWGHKISHLVLRLTNSIDMVLPIKPFCRCLNARHEHGLAVGLSICCQGICEALSDTP